MRCSLRGHTPQLRIRGIELILRALRGIVQFARNQSGHNNSRRNMPEQETLERARRDKRQGKAASTQAGEFIREEMHHIREGKHGASSAKQAIAIGLSKARRAGVKLPPPKRGSRKIKRQAKRDLKKGRSHKRPSRKRSRARKRALKREPRRAASHRALSRQAHRAARRRGAASRSRAAKKAARTRARRRRR